MNSQQQNMAKNVPNNMPNNMEANSTDDIMASIRHIIESNESAGKALANPAPANDIANDVVIKQVESHLSGSGVNKQQSELTLTLERLMTPLLREWLAENLPDLVERIVREEIELISRGTTKDATKNENPPSQVPSTHAG